MGFFNEYPYTDFHEINLDWILKQIMRLHKEYDEFKAVNTITNAGTWNITKQYQAWTIVSDNNAGYISLQPVPAGVSINNTDYWGLIADYNILITNLSARISALETDMAKVKDAIVTPEMFGAVGDGVTDDSAAVAEAFTHKNVICPNTYLLSDTVEINAEHISGGVFVYSGDNKLFDIKTPVHVDHMTINSDYGTTGESQFSIFYDNGVDGVVIENCTITNSKGEGVAIYNASGCTVTGNTITNCYDNGIVVGGLCDNNSIENNIIDGTTNQNAIFVTASPGSTQTANTANNNIVRGNRCYNFGDSGIESGIGTRGTVIDGNQVEGTSARAAILIRDAKNVRCVNNNVKAVLGIGIIPQYELTSFVCNNIVSNNTIDVSDLGIQVDMSYNNIDGNTVTANHGIRVGGLENGVKVNNNTITATTKAINLNYNAAASSVTGECKFNGMSEPEYYLMNSTNLRLDYSKVVQRDYTQYANSFIASCYAGTLEADITLESSEGLSHCHVSFKNGSLQLLSNTSDIGTTDTFSGYKMYMNGADLRIQRRGADITGVTVSIHIYS